MFESITDTLTGALDRLTSRGKLTETNIEEGLRDVRVALLGADCAISVVKHFIERVKDKAIGAMKIEGVDPRHQIVKVVHDELIELMGGVGAADTRFKEAPSGPTIIMMVGLQGSGKTTSCGKLAKFLVEKKKKKPLLVAADLQRPAAIDQLKVLGGQLDVPVYAEAPGERTGITKLLLGASRATAVCVNGVKHAEKTGRDVVILDTAGRLHIDDELMKELRDVRAKLSPHNVFLVCDAMTGQDAVNSAKTFNEQLNIDGVILTKLDGDARGGAALSIKYVTGKPVKFIGTGEKLDRLEEFHADRMASRILGMGDIVSLVEKAQEVVDQKDAERSATRLIEGKWNFEDFLSQLRNMKKLGPLKQIMGLIPGMSQIMKEVEFSGEELVPIEAIISSMTKEERKNPDLLSGHGTSGSRRRRIATGSGTSIQEVNALIKQFKGMKRMISMFSKSPQQLQSLMTKGGIDKMMPKLAGGRPLGHGGQKKNKKRR